MKSLLITLFAGAFFLVGTLIALYVKNDKKLISFSIGISFIVLILLIFVDILPEVLELFNNNKYFHIIGGVLLGLGILLLIEKVVPHHHDEEHHNHNNLVHVGVMTAIAIIIHNIIEGASIYSVALASYKSGLIYAFGVALHNVPFGIKITAMLKEEKKYIMWIYITLLTTSTFMGGLFVHIFSGFLSNMAIGYLLSITIGMIIYIVFFELLKLLKENFDKYSIYGIITGIILIIIGVII